LQQLKGKGTQDQMGAIKENIKKAFDQTVVIGKKIEDLKKSSEVEILQMTAADKVEKIKVSEISIKSISEIIKKYENFDSFKQDQEKLKKPYEATKSAAAADARKSAIRQAFEDYFKFVTEDVVTAAKKHDQLGNPDEYSTADRSKVVNLFSDIVDDLKNENIEKEKRLKESLERLKEWFSMVKEMDSKMTMNGQYTGQNPWEMSMDDVPDSVKKVFPEYDPVARANKKKKEFEKQARQKLDKEKEIYDAFKSFIEDEFIDPNLDFEKLLSEEEKTDLTIPELIKQLDLAKDSFKKDQSLENAKKYVRFYDELEDRLSKSSGSKKQEKKTFENPSQFGDFLNRYYDYAKIKRRAKVKNLEIGTYQYILYLYIRFGVKEKLSENAKFKPFPQWNREDYNDLKKKVSKFWDTSGTSFKSEEDKFLELDLSDIRKIINALDAVYQSNPFEYKGDITGSTFLNNFFRKTSSAPKEEDPFGDLELDPFDVDFDDLDFDDSDTKKEPEETKADTDTDADSDKEPEETKADTDKEPEEAAPDEEPDEEPTAAEEKPEETFEMPDNWKGKFDESATDQSQAKALKKFVDELSYILYDKDSENLQEAIEYSALVKKFGSKEAAAAMRNLSKVDKKLLKQALEKFDSIEELGIKPRKKPEEEEVVDNFEEYFRRAEDFADTGMLDNFIESMKKAMNSPSAEASFDKAKNKMNPQSMEQVLKNLEDLVERYKGEIYNSKNYIKIDRDIRKNFLLAVPTEEYQDSFMRIFRDNIMIDYKDQDFSEITNIEIFADVLFGDVEKYKNRYQNGKRLVDFINKHKNNFTYKERDTDYTDIRAEYNPSARTIEIFYQPTDDKEEENDMFSLSGKFAPSSVSGLMRRLKYDGKNIFSHRKGFLKKIKQAFIEPKVDEQIQRKIELFIQEVIKEHYG
jgi:hypothetical protein